MFVPAAELEFLLTMQWGLTIGHPTDQVGVCRLSEYYGKFVGMQVSSQCFPTPQASYIQFPQTSSTYKAGLGSAKTSAKLFHKYLQNRLHYLPAIIIL